MTHSLMLGIMQPYFFPYLGHFALIAATDQWIVFDVAQYTPKTWINRNRILHPKKGWQYVTMPLSNSSISIKIHEAQILDLLKAKANIVGKLSHYKNRAPYFTNVNALVHQLFDLSTDNSLARFNIRGLDAVCQYLGIPFNHRIFSELNLPLPEKLKPGDWALEICSLLGATGYLNPVSGRSLFDPEAFARRGISLHFAATSQFVYPVKPFQFEPSLSILDVLMWNSPSVVAEALRGMTHITRASNISPHP